MESAVSLANTIRRAVRAHPNKKPSDVEMRAALQSYQDARLARVKEIFHVSWMLTRLRAYDGWLMSLIQRWVMPLVGLDFVAKNVARTCSEAPKLDYVQFDEDRGTLGWKEKEEAGKRQTGGPKKKTWGGGVEQILPMVFGALLVFSSALWWVVGRDTRHALPGFVTAA
jgi:hypothetical protein